MPAPSIYRRAALVGVLVVSLGSVAVPPARAQTTPSVTIALIDQPVWHGPDDALGLRLEVSNSGITSLDGFIVQVRAYAPATSRSGLHQNFDVDPLRIERSSLGVDRLDVEVAPGSSAEVAIDSPVSGLTSLVGGPAGVYPITITLTDAAGFTALDSVTTQILYFPTEVESPLNVTVAWPITDFPSRRANGTFVATEEGRTGIETAIDGGGWLAGLVDALEQQDARRLRLGLAPDPRMVEELGDMADGFRFDDGDRTVAVPADDPRAQIAAAQLRRLRNLAGLRRLQILPTPYAFADVTAIDDFEHLSTQLTASQAVLEDDLEVLVANGWLFPPGGRLDELTLERLRTTDRAASTFVSAASLAPPSIEQAITCRPDFLGTPYTCPVKVTAPAGPARALVLDPELQQRFGALVADPSNVRLMQQLFAELAMVWAELPGTTARVVPLAVPPLWHPPPEMSARFVEMLTEGPWIRTRTPRGALHLGIGAIERDLVADAPGLSVQPDEAYTSAIDDAAETVESFARIRPPVALLQRLRRDVLVARSVLWWGQDISLQSIGAAFARDAQREAEVELDQISIGGRPEITLASRTGTLPLSLQNSTTYPVTVEVHLESNDRDLDLSRRTVDQTFPPGTTPLTVQVTARASGIYPVGVRVLASDGYELYESSIRIRSTEFNVIALAITLGAFAFLVLFITVRTLTRRKRAAAPEAG